MEQLMAPPKTGWRERAACLPFPALLFFGLDDNETPIERRSREEAAKSICETCAVRGECLDFALSAGEPYGIWGGLTELERKVTANVHSN